MCGALTHIAVTHSNILTSVRSTVGHPPASAHTERSPTTPCTAWKHQSPNSNFQTNPKSQFPNSQTSLKARNIVSLESRGGARSESRTRDLFLDQEALYQLSYTGPDAFNEICKSLVIDELVIPWLLVLGYWDFRAAHGIRSFGTVFSPVTLSARRL